MKRAFAQRALPRRQRGVVMVLLAVALVALLAMTGLALDGGHLLLSKTRLQHAVDAAALSAAKTLDNGGDIVMARTAALVTFADNLAVPGNGELQEAYADGGGGMQLLVEFSPTLNPFISSGIPPFVRVRAEGTRLPAWLVQVVGIEDKPVRASAVSGPIPVGDKVCDVLPILACGDPAQPPAGEDPDSYWGFSYGAGIEGAQVIKFAAGNDNGEPGNFRLLRLGDDAGGADLRDALAGNGGHSCASVGDAVETEPGNTVGPLVQGLNIRFGVQQGPPTDGKPDLVVKQGSTLTQDGNGSVVFANAGDTEFFGYGEYKAMYPDCQANPSGNGCHPDGVPARREVVLPIGDCSNVPTGQDSVPVLGFGCFFLLQQVQQQGTEAKVYGQFYDGCAAAGTTPLNPPPMPLPSRIVLYKDSDSGDS